MATSASNIDFAEGAAPATPGAAKVRIYAKADGLLYSKDDAGVETLVSGGAGGGSALGDHGSRVYNSAVQSLATSTDTPITFNSERHDTDAYHDTATNTSRLTVPTGQGGTYIIGWTLGYAANATGTRSVGVRLNGTTFINYDRRPAAGGGNPSHLVGNVVYRLAAGDYVELIGFQDSGGALNTVVGANYSPEFWIQRIA